MRRAEDVADIAAERRTEDDVDQVDPAIELPLLLMKVAFADGVSTHHHLSGLAVKPARSSIARPALSTICSSSSLPMRCNPSGRPCPSKPPGTLIAGSPARLAG